jgi:hypothetical protein
MKVFKLLFLLLLACPVCPVLAQVQMASIKYTLKGNSDFIRCDQLGNLYLVKNDQLMKYDAQGKLINRYSNKTLGSIQFLDVSNPMKILIFYPAFNKIVFLDNQLSENGRPVNLSDYEMDQTILACTSHDNSFWVYDQRNFELVRMDQNMQVTHRTGNIPQQTGLEIKPLNVYEYNNWLYACDSVAGIFVFDIYGTYYKTIPLKGLMEVQFDNNSLWYFQAGKLEGINLQTLQPEKKELPRAGASFVLLQGSRLYLKDADQTICYIYP